MLALFSLTNYQMAPALSPSNKITAALTFNSLHKLPFHSPLPLPKCKKMQERKQVKQTLPLFMCGKQNIGNIIIKIWFLLFTNCTHKLKLL